MWRSGAVLTSSRRCSRWLSALLAIVAGGCLKAEPLVGEFVTEVPCPQVWHRTIEQPFNFRSVAIEQTSVGNMRVIATRDGYGGHPAGLYSGRLTLAGTLDSESTDGAVEGPISSAVAVSSLAGGHMLAAYTVGRRTRLLRLDGDGLQYGAPRTFDAPKTGAQPHIGQLSALAPLSDQVLLAGWDEAVGTGAPTAWLLRTHGTAAATWYRTYGGDGGAASLHGVAAVQGTETWIAAGQRVATSGTDGLNGWLLGIDASGDVRWENTVARRGLDGFVALQTAAGAVFALGSAANPGAPEAVPWLVRLDPAAGKIAPTVTWSVVLAWARLAQASTIRPMDLAIHEEQVAVVGRTNGESGGTDAFVAVLDSKTGASRWSRMKSPGTVSGFDSVLALADGSFVAAGLREDAETFVTDAYIRRYDRDGHLTCSGACGARQPCDDGNPCTSERCAPASGQCVSEPVREGQPCALDGDPCAVAGACLQGACAQSVPRHFIKNDVTAADDAGLLAAISAPDGGLIAAGWRRPANRGDTRRGWLLWTDVGGRTLATYGATGDGVQTLRGISLVTRAPAMILAVGDSSIADEHSGPPWNTNTKWGWVLRLTWPHAGPGATTQLLDNSWKLQPPGAEHVHLEAVAHVAAEHHALVGTVIDGSGDARRLVVIVHDDSGQMDVLVDSSDAGRGEALAVVPLGDERFAVGGSSRLPGAATASGLVDVASVSAHDHETGGVGTPGSLLWVHTLPGLSRVTAMMAQEQGGVVAVGVAAPTNSNQASFTVAALSTGGKLLWRRAHELPGLTTITCPTRAPTGGAAFVAGLQAHGEAASLFIRIGGNGQVVSSRSLPLVSAQHPSAIAAMASDWWVVGERQAGSIYDAWYARVDLWGNSVCHPLCADNSAVCAPERTASGKCMNRWCDSKAAECTSGADLADPSCKP